MEEREADVAAHEVNQSYADVGGLAEKITG